MFDDTKKMMTVAVIALLLAVGYAYAQSFFAGPTRSVTTTGIGKKQVSADKASVTLTVSANGNDQNSLISLGEQKTSDTLKSLSSFNPSDVRKTAYQITTSGSAFQYATGIQFTIDSKDVQSVTKIMTASGNSIVQVKYSSSTDTTASQEARTLAINDARDRAMQIAKASGARVGKVLVVTEQSATDPSGSVVTGTKSGVDSNSFNEAELQSTLSVTFELR